jgi:hypothetical protein
MDPFTIATLGLAGANAVSSAVSGGKQNDLNEEALRLEREREADRAVLRQMFMERILSGQTPEQMQGAASERSAGIFGAGDANAPGRANPFSQPMAATGGDAEGWRPPMDATQLATLLPQVTDKTASPQDRLGAVGQIGDIVTAPRQGEWDRRAKALEITQPSWRQDAQTGLTRDAIETAGGPMKYRILQKRRQQASGGQ